jgi:prolycopene isomerase
MTDYDAIVIGAGNGGLASAAALARGGARVLVLERHNIPGGCATSFCRGRFEFEVSLHQLSGLGRPDFPGPVRGLLQNLGVLGKLEFVEMKNLFRFIVPDRVDVVLPANRAGIVQVLQERFPDEKDEIERFFDLVYRFFQEVISAFYLRDPEVTPEKYPLYFQYAFRDSQSVLDEYFRDPYLKLVIAGYWGYMGLPPRLLAFSDLAALLFAYIEFKPWHIKGGSQALSNSLAAAVLEAGGEIRFSCGAARIVTRNGAVQAVVTDRGEEITARYVVSNASAVATFAGLLDDGEERKDALREVRGAIVGTSFLTLYAGLRCPPEAVSISETTNFVCTSTDMGRDFALCRTLDVSGPPLIMSCYDVSDPEFSPEGACQAAIVTMKYAEPWLRVPPEEYAAEKYRAAETILRRIEPHFPGFTAHIEEMEIATPITHMRYLGHPGGSPYGFEQHVKDSTLFRNPKPPVKGLYGTGAWYGMPGYQPTLTSGAAAARAILREMSRKENAR